jgi:hypothetical protein
MASAQKNSDNKVIAQTTAGMQKRKFKGMSTASR